MPPRVLGQSDKDVISERERGRPLPEIHGDHLISALLREIEEEEQLSRELGVDLTPAGPDPRHAPRTYLSLPEWIRRADEVRELRERDWSLRRARQRG
jgi:hypothetical protein